MSGFGNIGTGLAGFMQGYQNSQQQAAQRALQQQALDQILRSTMASRLLGASSLFGGGIGNPTPQPSMPGTPSVPRFPQSGGGGAPPIPPAPAAPPQAAPPSMPPASPARIEDVALDHPIYAPPDQTSEPAVRWLYDSSGPFRSGRKTQSEMVQDSSPIVRQDLPPPEKPEPADDAPALGLQKPLSEAEYQRQYPDGVLGPPGGFHTPAGSATTAPTPSGSAGPGGGGTEQASAAGGSPANSSLFQQLLDPNHAYKALGEMRDRIAASAPPGTDPAVIWEATQQLYKLTNGGAMERAQLAAALKATGLDVKQQEGALNRGARSDIVDKQIAGRSDIVDKQIAGRSASDDKKIAGRSASDDKKIAAGDRRQERKFTQQELMEDRKQKAINERQDRRLAQSLEIVNRRIAASPNNPELKRYKLQLDAIKAQRDGILAKSRVKTPGGFLSFSGPGTLGLSDEEKKKVDELNQQIEGIAKQIAGSK